MGYLDDRIGEEMPLKFRSENRWNFNQKKGNGEKGIYLEGAVFTKSIQMILLLVKK